MSTRMEEILLMKLTDLSRRAIEAEALEVDLRLALMTETLRREAAEARMGMLGLKPCAISGEDKR